MNSSPVNMSQQRFNCLLRKTWNELTDADAEAICRDPADLVQTVQHRHESLGDEAPELRVQQLLYGISSLARVCRRLPVTAFV